LPVDLENSEDYNPLGNLQGGYYRKGRKGGGRHRIPITPRARRIKKKRESGLWGTKTH